MNGKLKQVLYFSWLRPDLALVLAASCVVTLSLCAPVFLGQGAWAQEGDIWQVAVPVGNARSQPETTAPLVDQLTKGTNVTELQRQGAWLEVLTPEGSQVWMHQVTLTQGVELFGVELTTAKRQDLRQAIKSSQLVPIREEDTYPYDLYDPSAWQQGATEMALGYTLDQQDFAVAEIAYRSVNDTEQVRQIAERVRQDLGPWQRVLGRRAHGPVEFEWRRGELRVLVHRGWPDTTTYLVYELTPNLKLMQAEIQTP